MLLFVGPADAPEVELVLLDLDLGVLAVLEADRDEHQVCPLRPLAKGGNHAGSESERGLTWRSLRPCSGCLGTRDHSIRRGNRQQRSHRDPSFSSSLESRTKTTAVHRNGGGEIVTESRTLTTASRVRQVKSIIISMEKLVLLFTNLLKFKIKG